MLTQSIPHGCSVKALDVKPQDTDWAPKQEYTILQKVATFEYAATLGTVCTSLNYYNCLWKFYVRIAAPTMVYQQDTIQVHKWATMAATGTFLDPLSRVKH